MRSRPVLLIPLWLAGPTNLKRQRRSRHRVEVVTRPSGKPADDTGAKLVAGR